MTNLQIVSQHYREIVAEKLTNLNLSSSKYMILKPIFQVLYSFKSGVINLISLSRDREFRLTKYTLAFGWYYRDREKVKGYLWKFKIDGTVIAPPVNKIFNRYYKLWDIGFIFVDSRRVGVEIVRYNLSIKFVNGRSNNNRVVIHMHPPRITMHPLRIIMHPPSRSGLAPSGKS